MAHARPRAAPLPAPPPRVPGVTEPDGRRRTLRGKYAAEILKERVIDQYVRYCKERNIEPYPDGLPPPPKELQPPSNYKRIGVHESPPPPPPNIKVCIVGAGMAGLYLAMMCTSLNIPFDIYEAEGRIGGRTYTYNFPDTGNPADEAQHNYYDVGAMRFPYMSPMMPVFNLFHQLSIPKSVYCLSAPNTPNYFVKNYLTGSDIDDQLVQMVGLIQPFVAALQNNFPQGFRKLLLQDQISAWEFFRGGIPGSDKQKYDQIQKWEMFDSATGLYNQAFSEMVLDYFDFNTAEDWYKVEGGLQTLTTKMTDFIGGADKVKISTPVTAIVPNGKGGLQISYGSETSSQTADYDYVFCTTTLGALQRINLGNTPDVTTSIGTDQLNAMRVLQYDVSVKVAIKFNCAWWVTKCGLGLGGTSSTDLPVRVVVYPSYAMDDPTKPTVMIASYTWAQDATRMASLVGRNSPTDDSPELLPLVLQNLVQLFATNSSHQPTYAELKSMVIDYHAYAWSQNSHSSNAFALFGPGQFSNLYPAIRQPIAGTNNKLWLCGEAGSAHHAWVTGSLYSSFMALYGALCNSGPEGQACAVWLRFVSPYKGSYDETLDPYGDGCPDELDDDVLHAILQMGKARPEDRWFGGSGEH